MGDCVTTNCWHAHAHTTPTQSGVDYYVRCWGFLPNEDYGEIPVPADLGAVLHIGVGAWHACAVVAATRRLVVP